MNRDALEAVRGGLIASAQAYPGEPMRTPETMRRVAQACALGGAVGIRAQGLADLAEIRAHLDLPLIGLVKAGDGPVYITPTLDLALACASAGSDVVAVDGTPRPRPDGSSLADVVRALHEHGALVMADCSTLADAEFSAAAGVDVLSTTLSGYTPYSPASDGPDLALVQTLVRELALPVIAEGRYREPAQVRAALDLGAHAVVVGTAITHPTTITRWFVASTAE